MLLGILGFLERVQLIAAAQTYVFIVTSLIKTDNAA